MIAKVRRNLIIVESFFVIKVVSRFCRTTAPGKRINQLVQGLVRLMQIQMRTIEASFLEDSHIKKNLRQEMLQVSQANILQADLRDDYPVAEC